MRPSMTALAVNSGASVPTLGVQLESPGAPAFSAHAVAFLELDCAFGVKGITGTPWKACRPRSEILDGADPEH